MPKPESRRKEILRWRKEILLLAAEALTQPALEDAEQHFKFFSRIAFPHIDQKIDEAVACFGNKDAEAHALTSIICECLNRLLSMSEKHTGIDW